MKTEKLTFWKLISFTAVLMVAVSYRVLAAPGDQSAPATGSKPERMNVDAIKQKYWAQGSDTQMTVVQNRLYTKEGRFEVGAKLGLMNNDPFLNIRGVGASVGYHFNETLGFHLNYHKFQVQDSTAAADFLKAANFRARTNSPKHMLGGELTASLLYGKLSLVGRSILYFDLHTALGGWSVATQTANLIAPSWGIGQRIYLTKWAILQIDYRLFYYRDQIPQVPGSRTLWSNYVVFGIGALL